MSLRNLKTIKERKEFLEKETGKNLTAISVYPKELESARFRNCENMIGALSVPLGVAGPLKINAVTNSVNYYIPLATTEGALVASVNRGCKALTLSGGANVRAETVGITRGAVFKTPSVNQSLILRDWIYNHLDKIGSMAEKTSSHLRFNDVFISITGRDVFTRFSYYTEDAMGMNMVTIASEEVVRFIEKKTGTRCISLAGNFDTDKKPAWINFILGRGKRVWAEAKLDQRIVSEVLKSTPEKIHEVAKEKCLMGSIVSGSMGFNGHFANVISALFIATGQDPGHIVEGSLGIVTTDLDGDSLYISVYLPDLMLGTVGGGTVLPAQNEALSLLGIIDGDDGKNALKLAEVAAGAVLAGELSLLASLAEGTLAKSHQRLARNIK